MKITINQKVIQNVTSANERLGDSGKWLMVAFTDSMPLKDLEAELNNVETMILEKHNAEGLTVYEDFSDYKTLVSINKQINDGADDITTFQMRG